jgi:hypothetical protein
VLDVHVDVLELRIERQLAGAPLLHHLVEAAYDGLGVGGAEDSLLRQHACVRLGALDVVG